MKQQIEKEGKKLRKPSEFETENSDFWSRFGRRPLERVEHPPFICVSLNMAQKHENVSQKLIE
jgi:hypothetical protein